MSQIMHIPENGSAISYLARINDNILKFKVFNEGVSLDFSSEALVRHSPLSVAIRLSLGDIRCHVIIDPQFWQKTFRSFITEAQIMDPLPKTLCKAVVDAGLKDVIRAIEQKLSMKIDVESIDFYKTIEAVTDVHEISFKVNSDKSAGSMTLRLKSDDLALFRPVLDQLEPQISASLESQPINFQLSLGFSHLPEEEFQELKPHDVIFLQPISELGRIDEYLVVCDNQMAFSASIDQGQCVLQNQVLDLLATVNNSDKRILRFDLATHRIEIKDKSAIQPGFSFEFNRHEHSNVMIRSTQGIIGNGRPAFIGGRLGIVIDSMELGSLSM